MKKRVIVISLGGSLIVPEKIDLNFLRNFRKIIKKNTKKYKFVIVCGGGTVARKYIKILRDEKKSDYLQSLIGISVTRLNARFMSYFFGKDPDQGIPHDIKHVKSLLGKNNIVFCGGLRYKPNQTSDATSAQIADYFKADFINLTNVSGLHTKNPKKFKNAKLIPNISRQELYNMITKLKYKPGQNIPMDQTAVSIIKKNKIKAYILGKNPKNLDNLLNNKRFIGTVID